MANDLFHFDRFGPPVPDHIRPGGGAALTKVLYLPVILGFFTFQANQGGNTILGIHGFLL
ncbi:MAG: hypothetical protein LBU25_04395 [Treponema sp.]|jgi:hypothetical protein|nr:hypothetical protein [Treponema sp.]